jgi:glycosyltransferase involved in cell wall biosynthesis
MFYPDASGEAFRRKYGLENKFVALYAGAHGISNDLGVVLDSALLLRDRPEIAIVLVGDGMLKPELMAKAGALDLTNVVFTAPLPKKSMPEALAAADACIAILKPVPLYATVYPNKVFDYMAAGRPVVLAMQGVIRELIEEARAGVPVPPGDPRSIAQALRYLADDPIEARAMGLRGRVYAEEHFDRPILAEMLVQLIETIVKNK